MFTVIITDKLQRAQMNWLMENAEGNFFISSKADVKKSDDPEFLATFGSYLIIEFENEADSAAFKTRWLLWN